MTDMPIKIKVKQCTICLDKIHMKVDSCTTLCKHTFHKTCIDTWARPGCPLCRQDTGLHVDAVDDATILARWLELESAYETTELFLTSARNTYTTTTATATLAFTRWVETIQSGRLVLRYADSDGSDIESVNTHFATANLARIAYVTANLADADARVVYANAILAVARANLAKVVYATARVTVANANLADARFAVAVEHLATANAFATAVANARFVI